MPSADAFQAVLRESLDELKLPGLGVGVVRRGAPHYIAGFGLADVARSQPVTGSTVFRIGSVTKTMTACAILQLCEGGHLQLDDPVNKYLKDVRIDGPGSPVTFRHLLTHTSGLGPLRDRRDVLWPMAGLTPSDPAAWRLATYYRGRVWAEVPAGRKWCYSNHGFALLGQAVEDVSGEPLDTFVRGHLFGPLQMHDSSLVLTDALASRLAQGYERRFGREQPVDFEDILLRGAGSTFSTLEDLTRYVSGLLDGPVPSTHSRTLLFSPQFQLHTRLPAMGLAFILERVGAHAIAWHNGALPGFSADLFVAPEVGLGLVLLANRMTFALDGLARRLLKMLLDVPAEQHGPGTFGSSPSDAAGFYAPAPGLLTNLHIWTGFGGEVEVIRRRDGHLALGSLFGPLRRSIPLAPVDAADPRLLRIGDDSVDSVIAFDVDAADRIDRLLLGFTVLYKRPAIRSLRIRAIATTVTIVASIAYLVRRVRRR